MAKTFKYVPRLAHALVGSADVYSECVSIENLPDEIISYIFTQAKSVGKSQVLSKKISRATKPALFDIGKKPISNKEVIDALKEMHKRECFMITSHDIVVPDENDHDEDYDELIIRIFYKIGKEVYYISYDADIGFEQEPGFKQRFEYLILDEKQDKNCRIHSPDGARLYEYNPKTDILSKYLVFEILKRRISCDDFGENYFYEVWEKIMQKQFQRAISKKDDKLFDISFYELGFHTTFDMFNAINNNSPTLIQIYEIMQFSLRLENILDKLPHDKFDRISMKCAENIVAITEILLKNICNVGCM